jgi:hypothetical protein
MGAAAVTQKGFQTRICYGFESSWPFDQTDLQTRISPGNQSCSLVNWCVGISHVLMPKVVPGKPHKQSNIRRYYRAPKYVKVVTRVVIPLRVFLHCLDEIQKFVAVCPQGVDASKSVYFLQPSLPGFSSTCQLP